MALKKQKNFSRVEKSSLNWDSKLQENNFEIIYLFLSTAVIVTCIKFMLLPAYYSTDFEVHRNWMAITATKPISLWYTEDTSQWTLDYPPFFAYFELFLSYFAKWFDPKMIQISAEPYTSSYTVFYQRTTVILSDLVYYYATFVWVKLLVDSKHKCFSKFKLLSSKSTHFWTSSVCFIQIILFLFNIGHFLVDHIHFQYNGFLNGLLLLSMARIVNGQIYWGSFWFAVLLNFKHIYLYMAPAYFIFLLANYCFKKQSQNEFKIQFTVLFNLAVIVLTVFAVSFGPFVLNGKIENVLKRLFPFQRGLSHAYWAPNFWALYNAADIVLAKYFNIKSVTPVNSTVASSMTTGLVQQTDHLFLRSITPRDSLICVLTVILMTSLFYLWNRLSSKTSRNFGLASNSIEIQFIHLILISTLSFFVFGYHVHEKAILLVIPPLIPLIFSNVNYARLFLIMSTAGYYSLFPLLFQEAESLIKLILFIIHLVFSFTAINSQYRTILSTKTNLLLLKLPILNHLESLYVLGFIPLHFIYSMAPYIWIQLFARYQFLPLMLTSIYCSIGICYGFVCLIFQN